MFHIECYCCLLTLKYVFQVLCHFLLIVDALFCEQTSKCDICPGSSRSSCQFPAVSPRSLSVPQWNNRLSAVLSMPFPITVILIKSGPPNSSCSISWCLEALVLKAYRHCQAAPILFFLPLLICTCTFLYRETGGENRKVGKERLNY